MSIYYTKDMLAKCRIKHYIFVNGKLCHRNISDNWHKSLTEKSKTPYANSNCEIIRVHQYRHKDPLVSDKIGVINAIERLSFETDGESYTTVPVGDIDVTTVSWQQFKRVMKDYFKKSDALYFTLDFARNNSPLMREMTWAELDECPDGATTQNIGIYAGYIAHVNGIKQNDKEARSKLNKVRSNAPHPVYHVHDVECLLYEVREVVRKPHPSMRSDLRYLISSMLLPALIGESFRYRENPDEADTRVLTLGYYLDGIYSLFIREVLSNHTLLDYENALFRIFSKMRNKSLAFDLSYSEMVLSTNKKCLFLPVDVHGYHTVPIFSDNKFALLSFRV